MGLIDRALRSSGVDISALIRAGDSTLNDRTIGATASYLKGLATAIRRASGVSKALRDLYSAQADALSRGNFTRDIIAASGFVRSGKSGNIVDAMKLVSKIDATRESIKERKAAGRKKFLFNQQTPEMQQLLSLAEDYGGGAEGMQMARDDIARQKQEESDNTKAKQRTAWRRANMDEYQQRMADLTEQFGSRSQARQKVREEALKGLPNFMKKSLVNSKISTKKLVELSNMAKKGPLGSLKSFISNPFIMGASIGTGVVRVASSVMANADKSNAKMVNWENMKDVYGPVPKRFAEAAMLAGITDPAKIQESWGSLIRNYGLPEKAFAKGGPLSKIHDLPPGLLKTSIMDALGLDPTAMKALSFYSGHGDKISPERLTNATVGLTEMRKTIMGGSSQDWWTQTTSTYGSSSVGARFNEEDLFSAFKAEAVQKAVDSMDAYQKDVGGGTTNQGAGGTINQTVNVGNITLPNVENGKSFVNEMKVMGVERSELQQILKVRDTKVR